MIGGGLAGLSAGAALAEAGYRIKILEKRPFLGGRATSYVLPNGEHVDNCQHITLGCCTNLADFYRRAGASEKLRFFDRYYFCFPGMRRGNLHSSFLPAPLHLAPSFLMFPLLDWADKRAIGRLLMLIARAAGRPSDLDSTVNAVRPSFLDWLRKHGQTEAALSRFWGPVIASALDEQLDLTDAQYGVDVFWKAFLSNRKGFQYGIPTVALGDLYEGCREALEKKGGDVRFRAAVRRVEINDGGVSGVSLEEGEPMVADHYISTVPQSVLPDLLPSDVTASEPVFANLSKLRTSPITGIHFWFDRQVMKEPYLALLEMTTQWIFNKTLLSGGTGAAGTGKGQYLQLVVSASYSLVQRSRQEIVDECLSEVRRVLPAAREAQLVKFTVIKEPLATFSPEPGCDRWRPGSVSPIRHLFLAGDWTATGWPATMEGAVRSGYLAAEAITAADGAPRKFLQPDLPLQGLSRIYAKRAGKRGQSQP